MPFFFRKKKNDGRLANKLSLINISQKKNPIQCILVHKEILTIFVDLSKMQRRDKNSYHISKRESEI